MRLCGGESGGWEGDLPISISVAVSKLKTTEGRHVWPQQLLDCGRRWLGL